MCNVVREPNRWFLFHYGGEAEPATSCYFSKTSSERSSVRACWFSHSVHQNVSCSSRYLHLKCQAPQSFFFFFSFLHWGKTCLICFRWTLIYWSVLLNLGNTVFRLLNINWCMYIYTYIHTYTYTYLTYLFLSETQAEYFVLSPENRV